MQNYNSTLNSEVNILTQLLGDEEALAKVIPLPQFSITYEEYHEIQEPAIKNFNYKTLSTNRLLGTVSQLQSML